MARCVDCHSLARVTAGRKSLVSWKNTIQVMVANGAVFDDKEVEPLAQYLAANFALPVNVNSATAAELSSVPGLEPDIAAAIVATVRPMEDSTRCRKSAKCQVSGMTCSRRSPRV